MLSVENHYFMYFVQCFSCFKWEDKSVPYWPESDCFKIVTLCTEKHTIILKNISEEPEMNLNYICQLYFHTEFLEQISKYLHRSQGAIDII